jgi:Lrp/AsnC family transcriptional regulator, leucine-responsive regulatory protein
MQSRCRSSQSTHESCKNFGMTRDIELDSIDQRILRALQADGRATYEDLARDVGLSPSATQRRVKRLEELGVIAGYVAVVAPERVGLGLTAYINVRLAKHSDVGSPVEAFTVAVQAWSEVAECVALSGEMDYLLRVLVRDMAHYSGFIMESLLRHPSVQDCKTSFLLRRLKGSTAVPL